MTATKQVDLPERWAERGEFWVQTKSSMPEPKNVRSRIRRPIVLTGHGMHLRINHGSLEVRNGFTHYPQQREEWRFFPGEPTRPSRIIVLDGNGAITFDVLSWLAEQDILLVQLDYRGRVVTALGGGCSTFDPALCRLQADAAAHPRRAMSIATWLVRKKLEESCQTLRESVESSELVEIALQQMESDIRRLQKPWPGEKVALLGIEGKGAQVYFETWREIAVNWKGTGRRPILESWRTIGPRRSRTDAESRRASHPFQAMLNYAYGLLESQLRIELAKVGLDPWTGFVHAPRDGRQTLVLDLIEPLRPRMDQAVLHFVRDNVFSPSDFTVDREGRCRLHPQLARRLVAKVGGDTRVGGVIVELLRLMKYVPDPMRLHRSPRKIPKRSRSLP